VYDLVAHKSYSEKNRGRALAVPVMDQLGQARRLSQGSRRSVRIQAGKVAARSLRSSQGLSPNADPRNHFLHG